MAVSNRVCGFKVGNPSDIPARFKCCRCLHVLRSPVQGDCGHRYCQDAIKSDGFACIACQNEGESEIPQLSRDSVYPDTAMQREISKYKFQCPWTPCPKKMMLSDLVQHVELDCEHREICCDQCELLIPASSMAEHSNSQCPKRSYECQSCKIKVPFNTLEQHLNSECIGSTEQCRSCLARVRDTDEARLEHAKNDCPVGWINGQACPFGCGVVEDAEAHRTDCLAMHVDRQLAKLRGGSHFDGQQAGDSGATALEAPVEEENYEAHVLLVEGILGTAELVCNLNEFGHPGQPKPAGRNTSAQKAFFDRWIFAGKAAQQLDKERNMMDQKLSVAYRAMEPLTSAMTRQYEELSSADSVYKELLCAMSLKEVRICDLERSISLQELGSTDGTLVWKISFYKERISNTEYEPVLFSPALLTDKFGYKLTGVIYLNGQGSGRDTHLSVFARINKGPYDGALPWPLKQKVIFTLLSQTSPSEHLVKTVEPDSSSQFQRPFQPMGQPFGIEKFYPKDDLESKGYLKDDTLFVKIQVAKPALRNF